MSSSVLYEIWKSAPHNPGENVNNHFATEIVSKKARLFFPQFYKDNSNTLHEANKEIS